MRIFRALPTTRQRLRILKCEIETAPDHAEVVVRPINNVPAKITQPANVSRKAHFEAAAELPDSFSVPIAPLGCNALHRKTGKRPGDGDDVALAAVKDGAPGRPGIRRKASAVNRIAQSKEAKKRANGTIIFKSRFCQRPKKRLFVINAIAFGVDHKSFNAE